MTRRKAKAPSFTESFKGDLAKVADMAARRGALEERNRITGQILAVLRDSTDNDHATIVAILKLFVRGDSH